MNFVLIDHGDRHDLQDRKEIPRKFSWRWIGGGSGIELRGRDVGSRDFEVAGLLKILGTLASDC